MSDAETRGYGAMDGVRSSAVAHSRSISREARSTSSDVAAVNAAPRTDDSFYTGIALLLLVVLLWTASSFLTQYQLTQAYDKPFAVTYFNTSSFALYLIPFFWALHKRPKNDRSAIKFEGVLVKMGFTMPSGSIWFSTPTTSAHPSSTRYAALAQEDADDVENRSGRPRLVATHSIQEEHRRLSRPSSIDGRRPLTQQVAHTVVLVEPPLDMHQTAVLAAQFMVVWFLANYSLNLSLKLTSVASSTTLSSASGFFTLGLGALVGVELFSFSKLAAVTVSFVGVLLVTRADIAPSSPSAGIATPSAYPGPAQALVGDLLSLASALFYSLYVVLLKRQIGREERVSMPLFFGFVGLINIVVMWPVGVLLHVLDLETLQLPSGSIAWAGVLLNMAITVVSDFAYLLAMLKSSPLVATVGLSLTIPLAILGDLLRDTHTGGAQSYLGSALVLASFVAVGLVDRVLAQRIHAAAHNDE